MLYLINEINNRKKLYRVRELLLLKKNVLIFKSNNERNTKKYSKK